MFLNYVRCPIVYKIIYLNKCEDTKFLQNCGKQTSRSRKSICLQQLLQGFAKYPFPAHMHNIMEPTKTGRFPKSA